MASEKYFSLHEHFYRQARRYSEMDEMKGLGEVTISVAYCQCQILIAIYEFKKMYLVRSWLTIGKAVRIAMMLSLNRLDGDLTAKQVLPPPKDFTEKEERRRTFWMVFFTDRHSSTCNGWTTAIDERDVGDSWLLPSTCVTCCF